MGMRLLAQRYDTLWLGLWTVAVSIVMFVFGLWGSGGHLAAPLDDTFIHFQYAKQLAAGHPFEYNMGDPLSSGESAFVYPFLLAPAFWVGLGGMRALLYADALNLVAHIVIVMLFYKLGVALGGRALGLLCGAFLLLDGRLNFSFLSGMETGIYAAALVAFFWVWLRDVPEGRFGWLGAVGAFAALIRPEGHVLVSVACVLTLIYVGCSKGLSLRHAWLSLPVLAGLVPYAVNVVTTGEWQYNTAVAKSVWGVPYSPLYEKLSLSAGYLITAIKDVYLGLEVGRSPFPVLAAPVAILGAAAAIGGARFRFFHILLLTTFVLGIALALPLPPHHFYRYYQPYDFIFWLYFCMGLVWMVRRIADSNLAPRHYAWAGAAVIVLILPQLVAFMLTMGASTRDIYYQQMTFSEWVRRYTPPDARIAATDVGAHKYLSDRYVMDLAGLTNNDLRGAHLSGWGTAFDVIARMPQEERPTHLLVHPEATLNGVEESVSQALLAPVYSIRVRNPTITAGEVEALYTIDWGQALLDPGRPYLSREGAEPLDMLNVGDLEDEGTHGYSTVGRIPTTSEPKSIVTTAHYEEENSFSLSESGRRHSGWEEFAVRSVAGRPLVMVSRSKLNPEVGQRLLVLANGREVGLWEVRNERGGQWQEYEYTIPAEYVTGERTVIRIDATFDPGGPGFASYRYWFYAR